jgi:crossover junction endodeoxyribonuclease RuvC
VIEHLTIVGIDPGKKGGIAIYADKVVHAYPMPLAGKGLNLPAIANLLKAMNPDAVFIEKVSSMPGQGVSSTFTFGTGYGQLQGIIAALNIPFYLVTPQAWKKTVLAGTPKDKDSAVAYCSRSWPSVDLIRPGCRKPHDGMADALCLMAYGLKNYFQEPQNAKH